MLAVLRIITSTQGRQRRWAIALIILACGVPLTLYAIAFVRAQNIQGVRHFLLAEVFAVAFLAFLSNRLSLENPEQHASDRMFDLRRMASALWFVAALGSVADFAD